MHDFNDKKIIPEDLLNILRELVLGKKAQNKK